MVAGPPQMPVAGSPAVQAGSCATFHLPLVAGAMPPSRAGAQAPEIQVSRVPSFICLFHCGENDGFLATLPSSTSCCQYPATFFVGASLMSTFQVSPLADHQLAPACWASPVNQPGSAASKLVRYADDALVRSAFASAANSSQVVGTVSPYLANRSAREPRA